MVNQVAQTNCLCVCMVQLDTIYLDNLLSLLVVVFVKSYESAIATCLTVLIMVRVPSNRTPVGNLTIRHWIVKALAFLVVAATRRQVISSSLTALSCQQLGPVYTLGLSGSRCAQYGGPVGVTTLRVQSTNPGTA